MQMQMLRHDLTVTSGATRGWMAWGSVCGWIQ